MEIISKIKQLMLRVGLTGGIGSGKSTVAKIFEVLGVPVYYADHAAKKIMNSDEELKKQIIRHFGADTYKAGSLDRALLASIVFADKAKLELLNSLTHPATIRDSEVWMDQQSGPYAIKEAALIFETDAYKHLDYVIGVYAPEPLRIRRVVERDKLSEEEVVQRMNRQMNEDEKMKHCDVVILNDEQHLVIEQVLKIHEELKAWGTR